MRVCACVCVRATTVVAVFLIHVIEIADSVLWLNMGARKGGGAPHQEGGPPLGWIGCSSLERGFSGPIRSRSVRRQTRR